MPPHRLGAWALGLDGLGQCYAICQHIGLAYLVSQYQNQPGVECSRLLCSQAAVRIEQGFVEAVCVGELIVQRGGIFNGQVAHTEAFYGNLYIEPACAARYGIYQTVVDGVTVRCQVAVWPQQCPAANEGVLPGHIIGCWVVQSTRAQQLACRV